MSYTKRSHYYAGCDGTKIALDLYLPDTGEKVPVLLRGGYAPRGSVMKPYPDGSFPAEKEAIERFTEAGYAVAIVEQRGSGASMGCYDGFFSTIDARDMASIIAQLTAEDWCSGEAGMFGGSNHGMIQEITACEQPPQLKCVIPCDCSMDFYYQNFPNGVCCMPDMPANHHQEIPLGEPVEEDPAPDYPMAYEAQRHHERNKPFLYQHIPHMYRDDMHPALGYAPNLVIPSWERMDVMRFGHVASWNTGAWFDPGCTNKILTYKSWGGRLLLGPWPHCGIYNGNRPLRFGRNFPNGGLDWVGEYIDYYDAILKHRDNHVLQEPPVRYYTIGDAPGEEWHYSADFPVEGTRYAQIPFAVRCCKTPDVDQSPAESPEKSSATGFLLLDGNTPEHTQTISYKVRDDIMIYGPGMRMNRNVEKDMTGEDAKSVVFTSEPIPADMEITGIPNMEIYVTSTFTNGNFIAVLEEVTPDGCSHFLTEGYIQAAHAKSHPNNIYASMGISYHRGFREDIVELSEDKPLRLEFHLEATSRIVKAGSRLRVAIACGGSGSRQPEGFPAEAPTVTFHMGGSCPAKLTLPVVKSTATVFTSATDSRSAYIYKKALYINEPDAAGKNRFTEYPCLQAYPVGKVMLKTNPNGSALSEDASVMVYETETLLAEVVAEAVNGKGVDDGFSAKSENDGFSEKGEAEGLTAKVVIRKKATGEQIFTGTTALKERYVPANASPEIPLMQNPWSYCPEKEFAGRYVKDLYVASVPVAKGDFGNFNAQLRSTFDLFVDLIYPEGERKNLPVMVNIHGFGGNHHQFERNTPMLLEKGYAVASIDYRACPPNTWPSCDHDANGCIRYLKAHADELGLDPERFGVLGGSMGGNLTAMIAAKNGDPAYEGNIGGNTDCDSSVKAACASFAFTDYFAFGDDNAHNWPLRPDKVALCDGPFAPLGSMLGYVGPGKGFGELKTHLYDPDPKYQALLEKARQASPITHVTDKSAPLTLIHGIFECGIQVPMGQSVRMFEEYTRKGVKALLLCNNNGIYGEDPEVKKAAVEFLANRV